MTNGGNQATWFSKILAGALFHLFFCLFGSFVLTAAITVAITAISPGAARDTELVVGCLASALLASFVAPRWFRGSGPWVGIFGLVALFAGGQQLYRGWSPTWSDQSRSGYILSQLFGFSPGCGDSECLYLLLFGYPFLCLTVYSLVSAVALRLTRKKVSI